MGKKQDLKDAEKGEIIKYLAMNLSTLKISKLLSRDHRTIKKFIFDSLFI